MDLTLVPFGYRPTDGAFVDVADVPRGKASGCICYSCRAPLVARQGEVKQWHFAHATRGTYKSTEDKCEFSFFVSVRMMARQVVSGSIALDLPAYRDSVDCRPTSYSRPRTIEFTVTESTSIVLSEIGIDTSFGGVPVDLVGQIGDFSFVVYFTHPGREVPSALRVNNLTDRRFGVVAIDLGGTAELFLARKGGATSYAEALRDFLSHDTESKEWIFHPRYERAKALALESSPRIGTPDLPSRLTTHFPARRGEFHCVICQLSWSDSHDGRTTCPKCNSHLYVSFRGYVD